MSKYDQAEKPSKLLSYFYEIPIDTVESKYSTILRVSYSNGRYMLSAQKAVYSFDDQYTAFKKAFRKLKLKNREIKKVLILGYGLGSIPTMLHKFHQVNADYTAIEIDPEVINLARKYASFPKGSSIDLICADAYNFVKTNKEQYDLICVDLFIDDEVPDQFEEVEFLQNLERQLSPDGLLLFNRLYTAKLQRAMVDKFYERNFRRVFPEASTINTGGNLILISDRATPNKK